MKLLEYIDQNKDTTQKEIANAINSSLAMVNNMNPVNQLITRLLPKVLKEKSIYKLLTSKN